jgi:hypothetical protein
MDMNFSPSSGVSFQKTLYSFSALRVAQATQSKTDHSGYATTGVGINGT